MRIWVTKLESDLSKALGRLSQRIFPATGLAQNRKLRVVDSGFLDGEKTLGARLQNSVPSLIQIPINAPNGWH